MKRLLCIGVLSASAFAACVCWNWRRSSNVYSLHVYAGGSISGPQWFVGSFTNGFGFSKSQYVGFLTFGTNADGKEVYTGNYMDKEEAKHPYTTTILLGTRQFSIRARGSVVGLGLAVILGLVGWFALEIWGRLTSRKSECSGPLKPHRFD